MPESEDSRTFKGDNTDGIIGYGGSSTHRHTDPNNPEEGSRNKNSGSLRQGQDQDIAEPQPTLNQTVNQNGEAEEPTPTPEPTEEPTESIPNVTPVENTTIYPTPTSSSSVEPDSTTTSIANTGNGGSTGMSGNTKVAIAVPVAIGGAAVIAGIIFLVLYIQRRKQRKQGRASLLPPANTRVAMGQAPAAATMVLPSSQAQAQAQAQPRNIDMSHPFDGSLPHDPSPPYQPSTNTGSSRDIDANHAAGIGVALSPEPQAPASPSPSPPPAVTGVAARNIQSQDVDSQNRAQSPFDDPIPDTFSDISRISGRRRDGMGSIRSAVSSLDDDEHEARDHSHGHGHGRMSID